jgi:peptidoglycan/LPS O-acetylase OafA/YrhL
MTTEWLHAAAGMALPTRAGLYFKPVGAVLLVAAVLMSPLTQRLLSAKPLLLLGRISFPLYLLHMPILCTAGCLA